MSKYSGKCDFYDHLFVSSEDENEAFNKFNGTKLYVSKPVKEHTSLNLFNNYDEIKYNSLDDLKKYYPYLICLSFGSQNSNTNSVFLTNKSYVDIEEETTLEYYLKDILKIYNACKRNKTEFTQDSDAYRRLWINAWNQEAYNELFYRVKALGKKATIDGIHIDSYNHYRDILKKDIET